jgi:general secretion pathway protein H
MWSAGRGSTDRQRGFTLVELAVVMVILGLMTLMALPVFSRTMKGLRLKRAVQEMTSVMRRARAQAVFHHTPGWVALDLERNRYSSGDGIMLELNSVAVDRSKTYPLPEGVELKDFEWMDGDDEYDTGWIQFYPNGSSSGGSVTLASDRGEARILLEPFTGLPKVEMEVAGG